MKPEKDKAERIKKILNQIDGFFNGNFTTHAMGKNDSDGLNIISEKLDALGQALKLREQETVAKKAKVDKLLEILSGYVEENLATKAPAEKSADEVDSLGAGLNLLAKELADRTTRLSDSEEQIETIFKNAPDAVIVINSKGAVVRWNPAAETLFGWREDEIQGWLLHEFLIPERYRDNHLAGMRHFLHSGDGPVLNRTVQLPALRRNNSEIEVELTISPAKLKNEYLFISFLRDVTERKKAEELIVRLNTTLEHRVAERTEELHESEKKYRYLFENNPMPMWLLEIPTLRFLDVNDSAIQQYGYTRQEFLSMTALDIRPEEEKQRFLKLDRSPIGTQNVGIWTHLKKDGSLIHVEVRVHEISFNGKPARLVLANDVTEKRKAEEALRYSEARFRKVFESKLIGFLFWDVNGNVTEANDLFLNMIGYSREELMRGEIRWTEITPPEYARTDQVAVDQVRHTGVCEPFEKEYITKDGKRLPVLIGAASLANNFAGKGVAYVMDISQRKKMQEEILELNKALEERVEKRTEELQLANKELESFTYTVSHDLRAPLRAILGYSQILFEDYETRLDTEVIRILDTIKANAKRMGQLVDDLLDFSHMRRNELNKVTISLDRLVSEVLRELKTADHQRFSITVHPLGDAMADPTLLQHVLQNLITNAVKYSSKKEKPVIEIGVMQAADNTKTYFVKDNGAGFDMKYYNKLFGVFQRLHRQEEFEGTGVGLAIVQRIVLRHGGRVWAEGAVNEGATFYFTLDDPKPK